MDIKFIFHPLKEIWSVEWDGQTKLFPLKGREEAEAFIATLKDTGKDDKVA